MHDDDRRVVVIGSGPAGATAVHVLCRAGIDVTLLEAGAARAERGLVLRLGGVTVAKVRRRPLLPRVDGVAKTDDPAAEHFEELSPGGLSNHWSCAVPRFSPEDFADAARAGEAYAWPLGYEDLVPWYDQVEPLLHVAGSAADTPRLPAGRIRHRWRLGPSWDAIAAAAAPEGRDVVPLPYAYGGATTLTLSGTVFNSYVRLVRPALQGGHLTVRHGRLALRVEWSREQGRAVAVTARDLATGAEERIPCRAVVVAAGAVASARLLLESTSPEFPAGLGNTEGVLGCYLHDHPVAKLVVDLDRRIDVRPPAYVTRPPLERTAPLYAAACAQWSTAGLLARSVLGGHPGQLPWTGFSVFGTMAPVRESRVTIDAGRRCADGTAGITLHTRHPPESMRLLEEARAMVIALLARAGYRATVRAWKIEPVGLSYHFGGTVRMHASPRLGMLDGVGRLHAVQNVVVADSAAFTTGPEKNPVLTAMALSARAADRLARDLRAGTI